MKSRTQEELQGQTQSCAKWLTELKDGGEGEVVLGGGARAKLYSHDLDLFVQYVKLANCIGAICFSPHLSFGWTMMVLMKFYCSSK